MLGKKKQGARRKREKVNIERVRYPQHLTCFCCKGKGMNLLYFKGYLDMYVTSLPLFLEFPLHRTL